MATIFTHPIIPISAAIGLGTRVITMRLLLVACIASVLPDIDVIGFKLHIPYSSDFGHRGFTHSLVFALLVGFIGMLFAPSMHTTRLNCFIVLTLATVSHGLIDACTSGGLGIALLWPFDNHRYFFDWRPIKVSPIGVSRFFTERGWVVILSELKYVWFPALTFAIFLFSLRKLITKLRSDDRKVS